MIVQIRVDSRLIHGQVVLGWITELETTHILVVDDEAATTDRVAYSMLHMAVQAAGSGQKLVIKTLKNAIALIKDPRMDSIRVFLITRYVKDAWEIVRQCPDKVLAVNCASFGFHPEEVPEEEQIRLDRDICTKEDVDCLNHLANAPGLEAFRQITPDNIVLNSESDGAAFRRGLKREQLIDILKENGLYRPES